MRSRLGCDTVVPPAEDVKTNEPGAPLGTPAQCALTSALRVDAKGTPIAACDSNAVGMLSTVAKDISRAACRTSRPSRGWCGCGPRSIRRYEPARKQRHFHGMRQCGFCPPGTPMPPASRSLVLPPANLPSGEATERSYQYQVIGFRSTSRCVVVPVRASPLCQALVRGNNHLGYTAAWSVLLP